MACAHLRQHSATCYGTDPVAPVYPDERAAIRTASCRRFSLTPHRSLSSGNRGVKTKRAF